MYVCLWTSLRIIINGDERLYVLYVVRGLVPLVLRASDSRKEGTSTSHLLVWETSYQLLVSSESHSDSTELRNKGFTFDWLFCVAMASSLSTYISGKLLQTSNPGYLFCSLYGAAILL